LHCPTCTHQPALILDPDGSLCPSCQGTWHTADRVAQVLTSNGVDLAALQTSAPVSSGIRCPRCQHAMRSVDTPDKTLAGCACGVWVPGVKAPGSTAQEPTGAKSVATPAPDPQPDWGASDRHWAGTPREVLNRWRQLPSLRVLRFLASRYVLLPIGFVVFAFGVRVCHSVIVATAGSDVIDEHGFKVRFQNKLTFDDDSSFEVRLKGKTVDVDEERVYPRGFEDDYGTAVSVVELNDRWPDAEVDTRVELGVLAFGKIVDADRSLIAVEEDDEEDVWHVSATDKSHQPARTSRGDIYVVGDKVFVVWVWSGFPGMVEERGVRMLNSFRLPSVSSSR